MKVELNEADHLAIDLATLDVPMSDKAYRLLPQCTSLGQAALLLAMDESALEAWYLGTPSPRGAISRVLSRAVDLDDVADRIDATLAQDPSVLADLVRAQITWSHPSLVSLLDVPDYRAAAAWMLSQTEPEPLLTWLDELGEPDELIDVARHSAPSGLPEIFDALASWHEPSRSFSLEAGARLEAALFVASPEQWARGFIGGRWEAGFLSDSVAIADIVAAAGQSYWTATLAAFEPGGDEFMTIARMVTGGAAANLHFGADDPAADVIEAFMVEDWEHLALHPAFAATMALAEEKTWQQPLLEAAMHDVLFSRGVASPGIGGLPLSSSHPDSDEIAIAAQMPDDVDPIAAVATMFDAVDLRLIAEFASLPDTYTAFGSHAHPTVAAVARNLHDIPTLDVERQRAAQSDMAALAAAERIARRPNLHALEALVGLWADGPLLRAGNFAALLHQELRAMER